MCEFTLPGTYTVDFSDYTTGETYTDTYLRFKDIVTYSCLAETGFVTCDVPGDQIVFSEICGLENSLFDCELDNVSNQTSRLKLC